VNVTTFPSACALGRALAQRQVDFVAAAAAAAAAMTAAPQPSPGSALAMPPPL